MTQHFPTPTPSQRPPLRARRAVQLGPLLGARASRPARSLCAEPGAARRAPLLALLLALLLSACTASAPQPPQGSCTLPLPAGASGEDAITAVLHAEGEFVVAQKIDELMALWGDGASIADAKHTPDDSRDDQDWLGRDAIRHRYVRTVFPGAPAQAAPADLQIAFTGGDRAVVTATTSIGAEVAQAGDRWTLVRRGECWLLQNLTYNLEPQ